LRIDKFWIQEFKNLRDFRIDFDEGQMTTVLIGRNGTGKSNLIEAIVVAFRDLDLGKPPTFNYDLSYICRGDKIRIIADSKSKPNYKITIDGETISPKKFIEESDRKISAKICLCILFGSEQ
jgi:predicted ATP-binding protein involved in virulence